MTSNTVIKVFIVLFIVNVATDIIALIKHREQVEEVQKFAKEVREFHEHQVSINQSDFEFAGMLNDEISACESNITMVQNALKDSQFYPAGGWNGSK